MYSARTLGERESSTPPAAPYRVNRRDFSWRYRNKSMSANARLTAEIFRGDYIITSDVELVRRDVR